MDARHTTNALLYRLTEEDVKYANFNLFVYSII